MAPLPDHAPDIDRVRASTWPGVNARLDREAQLRIQTAAAMPPAALTLEIDRLNREWDFSRVVETEGSIMGLLGVALAARVDRRLLVLPGFVALMMLVHATHGWYPLLPLFRRWRVRTRDEIDRERYALKAVRGDFDSVPQAGTDAHARAAAAWQAVWR